jgi:hypothetical protein
MLFHEGYKHTSVLQQSDNFILMHYSIYISPHALRADMFLYVFLLCGHVHLLVSVIYTFSSPMAASKDFCSVYEKLFHGWTGSF